MGNGSASARVRTITTDDETIETLHQFARTLGKTPIVAKESAGFVVNFLLIPYMLSAVRMSEHGVATKVDIDTGMKLGCGYPMWPVRAAGLRRPGYDTVCRRGHLRRVS